MSAFRQFSTLGAQTIISKGLNRAYRRYIVPSSLPRDPHRRLNTHTCVMDFLTRSRADARSRVRHARMNFAINAASEAPTYFPRQRPARHISSTPFSTLSRPVHGEKESSPPTTPVYSRGISLPHSSSALLTSAAIVRSWNSMALDIDVFFLLSALAARPSRTLPPFSVSYAIALGNNAPSHLTNCKILRSSMSKSRFANSFAIFYCFLCYLTFQSAFLDAFVCVLFCSHALYVSNIYINIIVVENNLVKIRINLYRIKCILTFRIYVYICYLYFYNIFH